MKSRQEEKMLTKLFTSTIFLRSLSLTPSLSLYIYRYRYIESFLYQSNVDISVFMFSIKSYLRFVAEMISSAIIVEKSLTIKDEFFEKCSSHKLFNSRMGEFIF